MKKYSLMTLAMVALLTLSACQTNSFINDPMRQDEPADTVTVPTAPTDTVTTPDTAAPAQVTETPEAAETPDTVTAPEQPAPAGETVTPPADNGMVPVTGVVIPAANPEKTFNITAKMFSFEPGTITVNEGDMVVINMTATDVAHGFGLKDFNVNERVEAGETKTIRFVADKKGTYSFHCSVFCGDGHGEMTGTLIVE